MEIVNSELIKGFVLAASLIIGIGAQNSWVLRQGISKQASWLVAFTCGLSDTILITSAIWIIGSIFQQNIWLTKIAIFGGCLYLLYFAYESFKSVFSNESLELSGSGRSKTVRAIIIKSFIVSLFNPQALLDTIIIIGGTTVVLDTSQKISFTIGAVVASWVWFLGLTIVARQFAPILSRPNIWRIINSIIGFTLLYFAFHLFMMFFH